MIILRVEVVLDFSHKSYDTIFGYYLPLLYHFSLFHELSILERSIAVRRACSFQLLGRIQDENKV